MARFCIYFGLVGGGGIPSSHMAAFLPQDHQALKINPKKSQAKANQKCMCGAPVVFCIFSPMLRVGDKGPVFPRDPSPAVQTSPTSVPRLLQEGALTPPSLKVTEEVGAPRERSGFPVPKPPVPPSPSPGPPH